MEKIIIFAVTFILIFVTYTRKKEFLFIFPSVFIIYRVAIQFTQGPVLDFVGRIIEVGAVAWIVACFYVSALYAASHYLTGSRKTELRD